ncbi:MAG: hypothetical protein PVI97_14390 [Candidatus Thiodiazotropha sp.]|jgi:hypothetical protein
MIRRVERCLQRIPLWFFTLKDRDVPYILPVLENILDPEKLEALPLPPQAQALIEAAADATPFCAICNAA